MQRFRRTLARVVAALPSARLMVGALVSLSLLAAAGCASAPQSDPQKTADALQRERDKLERDAGRLYRLGALAFEQDKLDAAADHFTRALATYDYYGPAHNDLGVVHLLQGDLYAAAMEFDVASRQIPDAHEPHYNLGLVFERAGSLAQAAEAYEAALKRAPGDVHVIGALARTYVKLDTKDAAVAELIADGLLKESRPEWQHWMRMQMLRSGRGSGPQEMPSIIGAQ